MPVVKWEIHDPVTSTDTVFDVNPGEGGSPHYTKLISTHDKTAPGSGTIVFEGQSKPVEFQVTGVLLSEEQYDFFKSLWDIHYQVQLTDDLGREFWIYVTDVDFRRIRRANHPWAHEYTMNYIELNVA